MNIHRLASLNATRNTNQIWLLWHDEPYAPSPSYNKFLFNWTITYRLDSEVSIAAYGIAFRRTQLMDQLEFNQWIDQNYEKRHNDAVW